ncbi:DUF4242 domain-containing protein [Pseudonocardia alaniniphila]|uniref:DUF4242 domain-containing protein n=1 Tax=Pseudonocardia alaniniphila TaxID=75291 RepID=A0ABS9TTU6_9PSEU|nr:DUF4242 domain-containing protein [Pseudonocardia alaniniphila]MCH6171987.1 DUF4242 domain-containing protein [Pseudonocardia alaniniphila]
MPLFLFELTAAPAERTAVNALVDEVGKAATDVGADLIESQVTAGLDRVFAVVEAAGAAALSAGINRTTVPSAADVSGPDEVRLVGADLAALKAARPSAGYLVEWDLPADLDMETYLERKRAKAPRYADVPEVSFLRTYVREDMEKCLCFYDAPDEDVVRRGRAAVDTPIDRLHALDAGTSE